MSRPKLSDLTPQRCIIFPQLPGSAGYSSTPWYGCHSHSCTRRAPRRLAAICDRVCWLGLSSVFTCPSASNCFMDWKLGSKHLPGVCLCATGQNKATGQPQGHVGEGQARGQKQEALFGEGHPFNRRCVTQTDCAHLRASRQKVTRVQVTGSQELPHS